MINFDIILEHVGSFGRYQIMLCLMVYYLTTTTSMHILSPVFYAASMSYRCKSTSFDNNNLSYNYKSNLTALFENTTSKYDACNRYVFNASMYNSTSNCAGINFSPTSCLDGYVFEKKDFIETTVSEWELVCNRKYLSTVESSLFFIGMMVGGLTSGYIADGFGRKPVLLCCCFGNIIFGTIASQIPWFPAFVVARFIVGICTNGLEFMTQVYVMEVTGRRHTTASLIGEVAFALGIVINSLISYFIRDWRYFYLAVSMFAIPYIAFNFVIPESPRWYFSKCRNDAGKELVLKFAKYNKRIKTIDESIWRKAGINQKRKSVTSRRYSALDLLRLPNARRVTIYVMICWFVSYFVSIGISLNIGNLSGNIFLYNALNGFIGISCPVLLLFTMNRIDRHILLGGALTMSAIATISCFFLTFFGKNIPAAVASRNVLSFVAYFGSWASINVLFVYTGELYPTVVRSNGMGLATVAGGLGKFSGPILISTSFQWMPYLVLGILSLIAGVMGLMLPETIHRPLPETLEEAESLYAGKTRVRYSSTTSCSNRSQIYSIDG